MATYTVVFQCAGGEHLTLRRDDGVEIHTSRTELASEISGLNSKEIVDIKVLLYKKTEQEKLQLLRQGQIIADAVVAGEVIP